MSGTYVRFTDIFVRKLGSVGIQRGAAWSWGIYTVIPGDQGEGKDRRDCMRLFRATWDRFAAAVAYLNIDASVSKISDLQCLLRSKSAFEAKSEFPAVSIRPYT
jgi:hypothetical protein